MNRIQQALSLLDKKRRRDLRRCYSARRRRKRFGDKPVIAVTGSVGKTTAVRFLQHVLSARRSALLYGHGRNSLEAAIAALRRLRPHHDAVVVEAASRGPGTLRPILDLVEPTVGITTTVSTDHFTAFRTLETTAEEKAELARAIPVNGLCLLNIDDEHVRAMASQTKGRVVFFGRSAGAEYRALDIVDVGLRGVQFTVRHDGSKTSFTVPVMGSHLVPSLLGAIGCAHRLGLSMGEIAATAATFSPVPHRCSLHQLSSGQIVISDTVKAPGGSVTAPFSLLDAIDAPRKTIVIGQISDYPGNQTRMYRSVCRAASERADRVILLKSKGKRIRMGIDTRPEMEFHLVEDWQALEALIAADCIPNEVILLKSSRNFHFERVLLDDVQSVSCRRAVCTATHQCDRCENLYDPECRVREKPPRMLRERLPQHLLPPAPARA
ncbi:MAG: Mur ligase family protein [Myxococcota bacterium]